MACLKPHRRLTDDLSTATLVRDRWGRALGDLARNGEGFWARAETHDYMMALFDHLTKGRKVFNAAEPDQPHPAPEPPAHWLAQRLMEVDRLVLQYTLKRDL